MAKQWTGDPNLKTRAWAKIRAYWMSRPDVPCARCGQPIDHESPRFSRGPDGRRRENPWALDVGHVVDRYLGGDHSLANTQPEHVRCGRRAGAVLGNRVRGRVRPDPMTSRAW